MATVAIDGDIRPERNLKLSSLKAIVADAPIPPQHKKRRSEGARAEEKPTVAIDQEDYNELCREVMALTVALRRLEVRLEQYKVN